MDPKLLSYDRISVIVDTEVHIVENSFFPYIANNLNYIIYTHWACNPSLFKKMK